MLCRVPSSELLFVGFTNGDIRGYSLTEQRLIVQIKKHIDIVLSLCYVPKHDVLISSSVDPHVYAWDCSHEDHRLKVRNQLRARLSDPHVVVCWSWVVEKGCSQS